MFYCFLTYKMYTHTLQYFYIHILNVVLPLFDILYKYSDFHHFDIHIHIHNVGARAMVYNALFNNISAISHSM
jgi:hypothetical protein